MVIFESASYLYYTYIAKSNATCILLLHNLYVISFTNIPVHARVSSLVLAIIIYTHN